VSSTTPKSDAIIRQFANVTDIYTMRSLVMKLGSLCREMEGRPAVDAQLLRQNLSVAEHAARTFSNYLSPDDLPPDVADMWVVWRAAPVVFAGRGYSVPVDDETTKSGWLCSCQESGCPHCDAKRAPNMTSGGAS
jgi:hypothetical protein